MSKPNVSTAECEYKNEIKVTCNTNESGSVNTIQLQEEFEKEIGYNMQTNGISDEDILNKSSDASRKVMVSQETVIDMTFIQPNLTSKNIMSYTRLMLKKHMSRQLFRKHQQGPYQPTYTPQGYPPQGYPPQGYPPPGYPPPGYPPPGYPPPGYPPQGYPQQGYPPPNPPPQAGGFGNFYGGPPEGFEPIPYDPETRNAFIRLVMTIVLVMLIATAIFVGASITVEPMRDAFRKAGLLILLPAIGLTSCSCAMCSECSQRPPCNFVILTFTTICMSLIAAIISCRFRTEIVVYAVIATAAVVLVCMILAFSAFDFTKCILYVIVVSVALSVVGILLLGGMLIAGVYLKPLHIGILVLSTIVQAVMLVMQIQMIIGGRSVQLDDSQYAMAAFMLYTSIVEIFIHLVQIIGLADR
ncbi:unnamed protein product [Arctia plantaginis]|uniref:Uncharacterized protein n=1 Tax=Arctia plantaginis TaxID=874455 RepID=A0A8S0ZXI3_ARCPL|nr:unnamed protein product [Arctia plantaginis]